LLWTISRTLFLVAIGYAAVGSILVIGFGRSLVGPELHGSPIRKRTFRAELVHVRENAEMVAIGAPRAVFSGTAAARTVGRAPADNLKRIITVNRNVGYFYTVGYNYFIQLIPVLIVAPALQLFAAP